MIHNLLKNGYTLLQPQELDVLVVGKLLLELVDALLQVFGHGTQSLVINLLVEDLSAMPPARRRLPLVLALSTQSGLVLGLGVSPAGRRNVRVCRPAA